MMKFASFETIVEAIYKRLPGRKEDYGKGAQTAVAFTGGYLAGILCAVVSHPADVMVSKLNANRLPGESFGAAMGRIYKEIGFRGLWNGLPVRIVMIGTLVSRLLACVCGHKLTTVCTDWIAMDDVSFTLQVLETMAEVLTFSATTRSRFSWVFQPLAVDLPLRKKQRPPASRGLRVAHRDNVFVLYRLQ